MTGSAERLGNPGRRRQFGRMSLTIVDRKAMAGEFRMAGNGKHRGRVQSAGKQDNGWLHRGMVAEGGAIAARRPGL